MAHHRWLGFGLFFAFHTAHAVSTQEALHGDVASLSQGELDQLSLSSDGTLTLGPTVRPLTQLPDPILWKLTRTPNNTLLFATGNDGRVYRLPPGGPQPTLAADFPETQVMALATSPSGDVFAATSPDGKVWRIPPSGEPILVADPDSKYVWDLAFDPQGRLLIAGGSPGGVWRVTDKKTLEPILKTSETHILSLATQAGTLYAGSAQHGYVYRVNLNRLAETPTVLLDAPGTEVRQVLVLPNGDLAALTLGPTDATEDKNPLSGLHIKVTGDTKDPDGLETRVFRLSEKLPPELWWQSIGAVGQSLGLLGDTLVLGLADDGKLMALHGPDRATWLADVGGEQLTALTPGAGGSLLVASSNPASVHQLEPRTTLQGTYLSPVIDAGGWATWGQLELIREAPEVGSVAIQTRSGNTSIPDTTWSPWADLSGGVNSGASRYLQYRLTLKPQSNGVPRVRAVRTYWQAANQGPKLSTLTVLDPGVRVEKKEDFKSEPEPKGINRPKNPPSAPSMKEREEPGAQGFRWEAEDPDHDDLTYTLFIREVGAPAWTRLKEGLDDPYFTLDARAWPDGWYEVKVLASDRPSNRAESALTSEKVSQRFPLDHTAPVLAGAVVKASGRDGQIRLDAQDVTSRLSRAAYSISGGPWITLFPDDGVLDEREERFSLTIPGLPSGAQTVVIEVQDFVGNRATGKYPLVIP